MAYTGWVLKGDVRPACVRFLLYSYFGGDTMASVVDQISNQISVYFSDMSLPSTDIILWSLCTVFDCPDV